MPIAERPDPRSLYAGRLRERQEEIGRKLLVHRWIGNLRLFLAAVALALVWLALVPRALSIVWVILPGTAFVALVLVHERLLRRLQERRRASAYYETALGRLDGKWAGRGEEGNGYLDPAHLYAQDLDIFGKGSLFELLSTARTHIGEDTLARWLTRPAPPEVVRARQAAVEELRPALDLREALAVMAEEARTGVDPVSLARWGEAQPLLESRVLRWSAAAFSLFGMAAFAGGFTAFLAALGLMALPESTGALLRDLFFAAYLAGSAILYRVNRPVAAVVDAVEHAAHDLNLLAQVLLLLERESFQSPRLRELRVSLDTKGAPPSRRIARLNRLMEWLDSRDNVFVRVAQPLLLYSLHMAFAVEDWRRASGAGVRRWLEATGEMEALCALASYAFEHPSDPFPEFTTDGEPWFEAEALGHPLIPEQRVVRNDVALGGELRVLVVSGSNMSGKSTLLRTIGINAVLAQAGAPVRARRLRLSPLVPGASIRVIDSLQGGTSRFYAEIVRLRDILSATGGPTPVLFLLDEFLHGTNSHDRRIGAEAMVRGLVERGAVGLITTHDLALAHIADALGARARNVHFEDHLENGVMKFDYVMRPGVVRKSNALELMRSVGLEI
jgi:MutS-like protein